MPMMLVFFLEARHVDDLTKYITAFSVLTTCPNFCMVVLERMKPELRDNLPQGTGQFICEWFKESLRVLMLVWRENQETFRDYLRQAAPNDIVITPAQQMVYFHAPLQEALFADLLDKWQERLSTTRAKEETVDRFRRIFGRATYPAHPVAYFTECLRALAFMS